MDAMRRRLRPMPEPWAAPRFGFSRRLRHVVEAAREATAEHVAQIVTIERSLRRTKTEALIVAQTPGNGRHRCR